MHRVNKPKELRPTTNKLKIIQNYSEKKSPYKKSPHTKQSRTLYKRRMLDVGGTVHSGGGSRIFSRGGGGGFSKNLSKILATFPALLKH